MGCLFRQWMSEALTSFYQKDVNPSIGWQKRKGCGREESNHMLCAQLSKTPNMEMSMPFREISIAVNRQTASIKDPTNKFSHANHHHSVNKCRISVAKICAPVTAVIQGPQSLRSRRAQNVEGEFYVDNACIDCDTCRWMAPANFTRKEEMSAVCKQPATEAERTAVLQALLSCPTSSIHTEQSPRDILQVGAMFPLAINGIPGVFHCGFHSKKSYGAAAYFIKRQDGNILIDSPRYTEGLAQHLEELGGVRYMFLTHLDDIADHERWHRRFLCDRIMHLGDIQPDTLDVEMKLEGGGPWSLSSDIDLIYTPGHTEGSTCLLYKPLEVLFTGDHVGETTVGGLSIFPQYCQCSVGMQLESVLALLPFDFLWIIPGHGKRVSFVDKKERNRRLLKLVNEGMALLGRCTSDSYHT